MAGGHYPLQLTCGHTRWSIHTAWRDVDILLRLQRGEPVIFVNPDDAKSRGIGDHDYAAVHNDVGEFVARVKLTPGIRPGQVHVYHAWLANQFVTGKSDACHQFRWKARSRQERSWLDRSHPERS